MFFKVYLVRSKFFCQCLNDLGDWKELADVAERSIDDNTPADLSKIWDDQYLQVNTNQSIARSIDF